MQRKATFSQRSIKEPTDRNFLLLNPNFSGLIDAIQLKSQSKPELGRILSDKGYKNQPKVKKEVALWAFVKEARNSLALKSNSSLLANADILLNSSPSGEGILLDQWITLTLN